MSDVTTKAQRDLRIDFFRGAALCMIFIDHVEYNPVASFTFHRFGFSDAAEIFVFLSGVSCGIVYSAILVRRGLFELLISLAKRAVHIYAHYVMLSLGTIALVTQMAASTDQLTSLDRFAATIGNNAFAEVWKAIFLIAQPPLPGILLLYVVLTLFAIPVFLLVAKRNALLALTASGSLWGIMQLYVPTPAEISLFPYFNPMAWQFLFLIGMYCGLQYHAHPVQETRMAFLKHAMPAAWAIVVISFVIRVLPFLARKTGFHIEVLFAYESFDPEVKYNLSALRLVHFLSVALIVAACVSPASPILRWGYNSIIMIGRRSLQTFSAGVALSMIGSIVFSRLSPSIWGKLAFNMGGIMLLIVVAHVSSIWKLSRARPTRPGIGV